MSGFWIKWEKGLTRKPEVLQLASRLMVPPTQAAGSLMLVMEWLDDSVTLLSRDGHADVPLGALQTSFIDGIAGISGFSEALAEVGWLRTKDNILTFVNVGKHNGTSAKSRSLATERKRKERARDCHASGVTETRPICSVSESYLSSVEGVKGKQKDPLQLRAGKLFNRRPETAWDRSEMKAWAGARGAVAATSDADWELLVRWFALPQDKTRSRKGLAALLNNWNTEISRAQIYERDHPKNQYDWTDDPPAAAQA